MGDFAGLRKLIGACAVTVGISLAGAGAQADFLGVYVGAGYWNAGFDGDVVANVDLGRELQIDGDAGNSFYVRFEHPLPILPNVRLARTGIKDSGQGVLGTNFTFNGQTFSASQAVTTEIDLTHTDVTLYYEIIDLGFDLDIGVTARLLEGEIAISPVREDVSAVLPMIFLSAKVGLPFSGLYLGADANAIAYSGNSITDFAVKIGWETENFILPEFGIEAGYRRFALEADEGDVDVDWNVAVDGVFINLTGHF